jgi:NAD+ synthase (glutamine-hydrolysing)
MRDWGFVRVTAASLPVRVADPVANAGQIIAAVVSHPDSNVVLFPELSLSGYTCGDLFAQDRLLSRCLLGLEQIAQACRDSQQIVAVGLPLEVAGRLFNVAAIVHAGRVVALVPKQFLPNYQEFYEARWFAAADGTEPTHVHLGAELGEVPFGTDILVAQGKLVIGVELCEDLWMPIPPSSLQVAGGANLILNLSASNELIGKAEWRETLIRSQSGRCIAAYAYASAGPTESTTDLVFGGHCLVADNGTVLAQSPRVGNSQHQPVKQTFATADIDLQRLAHDRRQTVSWQIATQRIGADFRVIEVPADNLNCDGRLSRVLARPFVPSDPITLSQRCEEIFGIQCEALAKRVSRLPVDLKLAIGVSGGLDSTLALLVAAKMCHAHGWPVSRIAAITMPGFGTTDQTLQAARTLMQELGVQSKEIDIRQLCLDTFIGLAHKPFGISIDGISLGEFEQQLRQLKCEQRQDLVFENVQARVRTLLLMNYGFVLGTGDLSEQALGWSTYNGDHMSMYNVNTSIPKTLVRFLIEYVATQEFTGAVKDCLLRIASAPISPELLPKGPEGQVLQKTEETIGAYELHDFFLYYMVRFGMAPAKILYLAGLANFETQYRPSQIKHTLQTFLQRFFANQFKRSCVPDGPKVGSVSLSPRGDWRMPSDAEVTAWLADLND